MEKVAVDHSRGLCGIPDLPIENTPRIVAETRGAKCQCCGSAMFIQECTSIGMQQLDMYWLMCPICPPNEKSGNQ